MKRPIDRVLVDIVDGSSFVFMADDREMLDSSEGLVTLDQIVDVLTKSEGWVEYETTFDTKPEAEHDWLPDPEPICEPAKVRIFGRCVMHVGVVYRGK